MLQGIEVSIFGKSVNHHHDDRFVPSLMQSHNEIHGYIGSYGCWNGEGLEGSWWPDQSPFVVLEYVTFRNESVDIIFHT